MQVAMPNSLADKEAIPKYILTLRPAIKKIIHLMNIFPNPTAALTVPIKYNRIMARKRTN